MTQDPEERKSGDARAFSASFFDVSWEIFRELFPWAQSDRKGTVWNGFLANEESVDFVLGGKRRTFVDGGYARIKTCEVKYTPQNNKLLLRFTYCVYTFEGVPVSWEATNAKQFDLPCSLE